MSLLRKLIAAKPVHTNLEFGILENCRLISISNEVRKRDGAPTPRHMYIKFGQFNDEGVLIANSEFNYYNLQHDHEKTLSNLGTELCQLNNLVSIINPGKEVDPTADFEDEDEMMAAITSKKGCKALQDDICKQFEKAVGKKVGLESPLFRLKVITDYKTGKYVQLSDDATIAEAMDVPLEETVLKITANEIKNKAKALLVQTNAKPDAAGDKPTKSSAIKGI